MIRKTTDIDKRIRVINSAIALTQLKKRDEATKLLGSLDWTASVRDFQLAICVLKNEFALAADLMKKIGKEGEVIFQLAYHNWPLFQEFRDRPEFHDAYELVYGVPFIEKAKEEVHAKVVESTSPELADDKGIQKATGGPRKNKMKTPNANDETTLIRSVARSKPRAHVSPAGAKRRSEK
jgi:hypothetical protein